MGCEGGYKIFAFRIIRDRKILADNAPFIRHAVESLTIMNKLSKLEL